MLTERFNTLWRRLIERWLTYQQTPRSPELVTELAAARIALDEARTDIAGERGRIEMSHRSVVEPPRVAVSEGDLGKLRVAGIGVDIA